MQELIDSISSEKLQIASINNMATFYSIYGRGEGCTLISTPRVVCFYSGLPVEVFNGVVSIKMTSEDVQQIVESLQARLNERGGPAMWWLGPQSAPENIGVLLEHYGLQHVGETPDMAIDLTALSSKPKTIEGFRIEKVNKVDNAEGQALWARTAAKGFGLPDSITTQLAELEATFTDAQYKAIHHYIGFLDDVPVATSSMVLDAGVAGIYAVATVPEARRKGIGEAITVMPLLEARQMGYQVGILQSSSMGYSIYQKIGFQDVFKFQLYLQSKQA